MSYTCLNYHIVFATKLRRPLIGDDYCDRLYGYIAGIVNNMKSRLHIVNGTDNHIHMLVSLPPDITVSEFMRIIKVNSSRWIHQTLKFELFEWQEGYSAFSVSHSALSDVRRYIEKQKEHHKKLSFSEEMKAFLDKHGIDYDPKFT